MKEYRRFEFAGLGGARAIVRLSPAAPNATREIGRPKLLGSAGL
jgi:hypothetical protein